MSTNTGGPAFPRPAVFTPTHGLASVEQDGMTLRDYFAAKAMQGLLANNNAAIFAVTDADYCFAIAEAMLKARQA